MGTVKHAVLTLSDLNWKQALHAGLCDATAWVWFLATAYTSRLTQQLGGIALFGADHAWLSIATCFIVSVVLVAMRWDRTPRLYRVVCSGGACASVGLLLGLQALGAGGDLVSVPVFAVFVAVYYGSQVLRVEALSACGNLRTLLCALIVSFVGYYALSAALLAMPLWLYDVCITLAPLVFLADRASAPASQTSRDADSWWVIVRRFAIPPTLFMLLFGVAGGLLTAAGKTVPAQDLAFLFINPSPVYLAMVLAYLALGILAAQGYHLRRATYFAAMSVVWMLGTFLGSAIIGLLPGFSTELFTLFAAIIALAIVASFVVFRNLWLQTGDGSRESVVAANAQRIAGEHGLTARETEVLMLLVDGRSLPYVQQRLSISEGTARTHIKHIYTKLDVHSKQDLIDLVRGE